MKTQENFSRSRVSEMVETVLTRVTGKKRLTKNQLALEIAILLGDIKENPLTPQICKRVRNRLPCYALQRDEGGNYHFKIWPYFANGTKGEIVVYDMKTEELAVCAAFYEWNYGIKVELIDEPDLTDEEEMTWVSEDA